MYMVIFNRFKGVLLKADYEYESIKQPLRRGGLNSNAMLIQNEVYSSKPFHRELPDKGFKFGVLSNLLRKIDKTVFVRCVELQR